MSHLPVAPSSRRKYLLPAIVVGLAVTGLITWLSIQHGEPPPHAAAAKPASGNSFRPSKEQFASFGITEARSMSFRSEQRTDGLIGVNENTTTSVFSPFSGRVTRIEAKLGDTVRKNDPLMTVEASEFVQGQNDLIAAAAALNSASEQLQLAKTTESRQHELYLAKAGAMKDWLQAQADLTTAQNNFRSAETALAAARNRLRILGKSDQEIKTLEHEPLGRAMQPEAVVRSPINGTIVQRNVGLGQYIQSASGGATNAAFSIADLSTVWLVANLREADVGSVKLGQSVEVNVPAYPGRSFRAKITQIAPMVDPATRRVPVRAQIDNRDLALKPQMLATFSIFTGEATQGIGIPEVAVIYEGDTARIFVARNDLLIESRYVKTGRRSGDLVEITEGLKAGEKVVTSGALFIDRVIRGI